jgi:hypothetical protein
VLSQDEADEMLAMQKRFRSSQLISLDVGVRIARDLDPVALIEPSPRLMLDIQRATIRLSKIKYQHRGARTVVLARLDVSGSPHTNPDQVEISGTHLHLFREGFEDKWASELVLSEWTDLTDKELTLRDFCKRFNIDQLPPVRVPLPPASATTP